MSVAGIIDQLVSGRERIKAATLDGLAVGAGLVAQRLFALLTAVIIARSAGVDAFGEYTLFMTCFLFFMQVPLAMDTTFIRFANAREDASLATDYYATSLVAKLLCGAVMTVGAWLAAPAIAAYVFDKEQIAGMIRISALAGSLHAIGCSLSARYQQKRRFSVVGILDPLFNTSVLVVVGAAVMSGAPFGVDALLAMYLGVATVFAIVVVAVSLREIYGRIGAAIRGLPGFLRIGLVLLPSSMLMILATRLDIFFIARLISLEELGRYGAAVRISMIASLFTAVIGTILMPHAPGAIYNARRYRNFLRLAGFYIGMQSAISIVLMLFAETFSILAFGPEYRGVQLIAALLIAQQLLNACGLPFQALIKCGPRPRDSVVLSAARIAVSVMFLAVLCPRYGTMGAAGAMAATSAVLFAANAWAAVRTCRPA